MVKLRRISESELFLESEKDKEDLKNHLGEDLYNDYMKIRDRIPKDQNDYKDFQQNASRNPTGFSPWEESEQLKIIPQKLLLFSKK